LQSFEILDSYNGGTHQSFEILDSYNGRTHQSFEILDFYNGGRQILVFYLLKIF
jgi:hypothetical protein